MFPQLGPPIGFLMANGLFLALLLGLGERAFVAWAWRMPFLLSAVLVAIGLYVRVSIERNARPSAALARNQRVKVPLLDVLRAPLAAADPGLAGDRRLLRAVLHFDGFRARLWRQRAGISRAPISSPCCASRCCSWRRRRRSRPRSPTASAAGRCCSARARSPPCRGSRCPRCSAAAHGDAAVPVLALGAMGLTFAPLGALLPELFPTRVALYRRVERLQSRRHSRRFACALSRPIAAGARRAAPGSAITSSPRRAVSFLSLITIKETRDAPVDAIIDGAARARRRTSRAGPRSGSAVGAFRRASRGSCPTIARSNGRGDGRASARDARAARRAAFPAPA